MKKFVLVAIIAFIGFGVISTPVTADDRTTSTFTHNGAAITLRPLRGDCYRVTVAFTATPIPLLVPNDPPPWTIDPGKVTYAEHKICAGRDATQAIVAHWWDRNVMWTYLPVQTTREFLGNFMSCHLEDLVNGFGPSQIYKGIDAQFVSFGGSERSSRTSIRWSQTGQPCPWF